MMMKKTIILMFAACLATLVSCAGERQGLVCEEMEYRLNTMTYSPDQRAYMEEELRVCREQEGKKKAEGAAARQSIYDRFASSDSAKVSNGPADSNDAASSRAEISVKEALQDSSEVATQSIYDRYSNKNGAADSVAIDTSAADAAAFQ